MRGYGTSTYLVELSELLLVPAPHTPKSLETLRMSSWGLVRFAEVGEKLENKILRP